MSNLSDRYIRLDKGLGLRRLKGEGDSKTRMFLFPFVGGQALSFKLLIETLHAELDVFAIDPPGHGWAKGSLISSFEEMIQLYYSELKSLFGDNFYLCGHSLGGIIAYRLAQMLEEDDIIPKRVIISASPLPHRILEYTYLEKKDKMQLIEILGKFGGMSDLILKEPMMLDYYYNQIKADVDVFLKTKVNMNAPLRAPMTVLYSKGDSFVNHSDVFEWGMYGTDVSIMEAQGDHMFILTEHEEMGRLITKAIEG